jgi:hypothetical protein
MLINFSSHLIYAGGVVHVENLKHVDDIEVARYSYWSYIHCKRVSFKYLEPDSTYEWTPNKVS